MDFISPIVTPIVESLLVPIKKHLGFLVSSTKYVIDMEKKVVQLNHTEQDVQGKKKTADALNHEVSHHVSPWLEEVINMKEKVERIPTGGIGCFSPVKRYKAGKQSYALLQEIKALIEREAGRIIWTEQQKPLARVPSTFTSVSSDTQNNFESRDLIYKNALKALQSTNEPEKMIALCGMGGVGKTTMMEQLLKAVKDSKMFDWVVKVVLGEEADPISLQQAIAQYIGQDLTETTKDARADRLRERFMGMSEDGKKKVLIIMDDVWNQVDLQDIGLTYPLPNGYNLLITSRSESVCTQMGVKSISIFKVHVLSEAEARQLFFQIVQSDDNDHVLQKIGESIVRKCGGLPIAIVTIAKVLRSNIKETWIEILSNLQQHDLQDLQSIVHKIFKISYDNLETKDEKALFLLSGLFPEDSNVPIEDLMMYGRGLKLFSKVNTLAQARRRTNICVNNLVRANLLIQSESMGCVKVHDLVRAFILSNFTEVKQASLANQDSVALKRLAEDESESYQRVLLNCTDGSEFSADITDHDRLSLLILLDGNKSLKFPIDLLEKMKNIEVVTFEGMRIPVLPTTFIHSINLRTLCLRSCSLIDDDIYHIGSLINLEILSFAKCDLRRLPSAIGKLKNLKSLDLTGCYDLCIEDGVLKNLESLEELYMRASRGQPLKLTDANCEDLKILSKRLFALEFEFFENEAQPRHVSFKNLERFRISIGCQFEETKTYLFRNTLHLVGDYEELMECNISDLFKETEVLHLQVNDMYHLQGLSKKHSFFNLRDLHISKCLKLTHLFTFDVASGLKKLEQLTVSHCPVLRTLVGEKVGVISLPKLRILSLEGLPEMLSLCEDVIELPNLLGLRLDELLNFTSIYSDNNNNISAMQTLLNGEVVIPKIENIYISRMENLKQIWPFEIATAEKKNVSMLKKITIKRCDSLVNIFPTNPLPLLNHLEEIKVEKCGSVEVLFNIDFECVCEMEGYISRLRSIKVNELGRLKELWRMRGVNNSDIHINVFKSVERIRIRHCGSFIDLFTPTITKFDLGSLTTYDAVDIGEKNLHSISKRDITEMDNLTNPSYLLYTCHHLKSLYLINDRRVGEVVFEMDSTPSSSRKLPTTIQPSPPLLLPYLEDLRLTNLWEMSHVWKCNWNAFTIPQHQPEQFPFQNLANISLSQCPIIKYLFSPLMANYLSNLKKVDIYGCNGIEEVISSRDDVNVENTTSTSSNKKSTFFPRLDTLTLKLLPCLKSVDGLQSAHVIYASWSFCQYPRKIDIYDCYALGNLVPWYAVGQMKKLEKLTINRCERMTEVFESESMSYDTNDVDEGGASNVTAGAILTTPTLKGISTTVVGHQLSNLKSVFIYKCDLLQHIFTFSTLESLKQLKKLTVKNCKALQVIVKEEKGASSELVVFPRLETIELKDLPSLKGFFLGVNNFQWLSLRDVMIYDCPEWMMFTSGQSKTQKLKCIHTNFGKYSVEPCDLNFQTGFPTSSEATSSRETSLSFLNLVELRIVKDENNETFIFPSHALLQLQKLEKIIIRFCDGVKEVFQVELEERNYSGFSESQTPTVVTIPNLTQVELYKLHNLKYIWKSSQWMVLKFPNLTTVDINSCDKLEHVFTCSMVGSLVQLQVLSIKHCKNIKVIVKEEEEECDAKVNEIIMLPRLSSLKLEYLLSLKGFCLGNDAFSLPTLNKLLIKGCPEVTLFTKGHLSTPELKEINTSFGLYNVEGDINSFIKTKQEEWYPEEDDLSG